MLGCQESSAWKPICAAANSDARTVKLWSKGHAEGSFLKLST